MNETGKYALKVLEKVGGVGKGKKNHKGISLSRQIVSVSDSRLRVLIEFPCSRFVLVTYCVRQLHAVPFLKNEILYALLISPKSQAL